MRKLFYFAPTFYPSPTGFGIAFTNIVKLIVEANYFDKIIIITTDKATSIPDEIKHVCELYHLNIRGVGKISMLPEIFSINILKFFMKDLLNFIASKNPTAKDIFFYEEFYIAYTKFILEKIYPSCEHLIRVHGTFPEYTKNYQGLKSGIRLFNQGTNSKNKKIVSTTNFYIEYLNKHYFDDSYDVIQDIDYFILPNVLIDIKPVDKKLDDKLRLFQLGRMDENGYFQKGFEDTVKALQYIESMHPEMAKKIVLTVIGDGSHAQRFQEKIDKLNIVEVVYLKKAPNIEVQKIIDNSDVILMPSRCEGMSMFATEAIYKGKAIIFTAKNGLRDYLKNGINGIQIEEYDYTDMANAIINYFINRNLVLEHGKNNIELSNYITMKTKACMDVIFKG